MEEQSICRQGCLLPKHSALQRVGYNGQGLKKVALTLILCTGYTILKNRLSYTATARLLQIS